MNVATTHHPIVARATILAVMRIEHATSAHAPGIAAIYDEAARTTPATFDLEGHEPSWWAEAIAANAYPFFVAIDNGDVLGFARAAQHKVKPAYGTTCETSVYVGERARGRGVGRALYDVLLAELEAAPGLLLAVAGITEPNPASIALHSACGFTPVGTFHNVGEKLGRTWDVTWYERPLGLCSTCAHQKLIRSGRGSTFSMCLRHQTDPRYPKYPRLPVIECPGHESRRT
jgi:L-amino acid N-acyltransferase YncA